MTRVRQSPFSPHQEKNQKNTKVAVADGRSAFLAEDFFYDRQGTQSGSTVFANVHRTSSIFHRQSSGLYRAICPVSRFCGDSHLLRLSEKRLVAQGATWPSGTSERCHGGQY